MTILDRAEAFLLEASRTANHPDDRKALQRAARTLFQQTGGGQNRIDDRDTIAAIAELARSVPRGEAIRRVQIRLGLSDTDKRRLRRKMNSNGAVHDEGL